MMVWFSAGRRAGASRRAEQLCAKGLCMTTAVVPQPAGALRVRGRPCNVSGKPRGLWAGGSGASTVRRKWVPVWPTGPQRNCPRSCAVHSYLARKVHSAAYPGLVQPRDDFRSVASSPFGAGPKGELAVTASLRSPPCPRPAHARKRFRAPDFRSRRRHSPGLPCARSCCGR